MNARSQIILNLYNIGAIKLNFKTPFKLKSGTLSPIYIDLRLSFSDPILLTQIAEMMLKTVEKVSFDAVLGVPYGAIPYACALSQLSSTSLILLRKEQKDYGQKKLIEGLVDSQIKSTLLIEDVLTTGSSVFETLNTISSEPINVTAIVSFFTYSSMPLTFNSRKRTKSSFENSSTPIRFKNKNKSSIPFHSVFSLLEVLNILKNSNKISSGDVSKVLFNWKIPTKLISTKSYSNFLQKSITLDRKTIAGKIGTSLCRIIEQKQSNLAIAIDTNDPEELVSLVTKLGRFICILKTHLDLIDPVKSMTIVTESCELSANSKHGFG